MTLTVVRKFARVSHCGLNVSVSTRQGLSGVSASPGWSSGRAGARRGVALCSPCGSAVAGTSLRLAGVLFGLGCELVFT